MQPPGGVDEDQVDPARAPAACTASNTTLAGSPPSWPRSDLARRCGRPRPRAGRRPRRGRCRRRRAAPARRAASRGVRELGRGRRLADPVDADEQPDAGLPGHGRAGPGRGLRRAARRDRGFEERGEVVGVADPGVAGPVADGVEQSARGGQRRRRRGGASPRGRPRFRRRGGGPATAPAAAGTGRGCGPSAPRGRVGSRAAHDPFRSRARRRRRAARRGRRTCAGRRAGTPARAKIADRTRTVAVVLIAAAMLPGGLLVAVGRGLGAPPVSSWVTARSRPAASNAALRRARNSRATSHCARGRVRTTRRSTTGRR